LRKSEWGVRGVWGGGRTSCKQHWQSMTGLSKSKVKTCFLIGQKNGKAALNRRENKSKAGGSAGNQENQQRKSLCVEIHKLTPIKTRGGKETPERRDTNSALPHVGPEPAMRLVCAGKLCGEEASGGRQGRESDFGHKLN